MKRNFFMEKKFVCDAPATKKNGTFVLVGSLFLVDDYQPHRALSEE
jgi:monoamine oxidase